jgi:enediyne biosynthesis protein E4
MKTRSLPQLLVPGLLCLLLDPVLPQLSAQAPPEFASRGQPVDQSVSLEADVRFSVRANGEPPLHYQWRYEAVPILGATDKTLTLAQVQTLHAGGYDVVVSNLYGSVTSQVATLTVDPTFTKLREGPTLPMLKDRANFSGAAWGDYDGDGDLDLFVTTIYSGNHLYRNLLKETGEAGFSRVAAEDCAPCRNSLDYSGAWADFDNDGHLDLVVGGVISSTLYRNVGEGQLRRLAHLVGEGAAHAGYGVGAAWGDLDNDGLLDLNLSLWGGPTSFVLRNHNGATFRRFGIIDSVSGQGLSSVWSDFDGDGDLDLFAADSAGLNGFWLNHGDGRLTRDRDSAPGQAAHGSGAGWADFDNDGRLDLYVANGWQSSQRNALYWNEGPNGFTAASDDPPVDETLPSTGVALGDFDNDGLIDIYVGNQNAPNTLYRNLGGRQFERITTGSPVNDLAGTVTPCWVDYDNDGDLDLFATTGNWGAHPASYQNLFYRNNGNANHWIRVRCVGGQRPGLTGRLSNRDGIGAKVRVEAVIRGETV